MLFPSDLQLDRSFRERFPTGTDQGQISSTSRSGHLPCENAGHSRVFINILLYATLNHRGEHCDLRFKGGLVSRSEARQVARQNRIPASTSSGSKRYNLRPRDILTFHHGTAGTAGFHGNHAKMVFQPFQDDRILAGFKLIRPKPVVVIVSYQPGHADADGILRPGNEAV